MCSPETKVEAEFTPVFDNFGLGLCVWSPLAGGILTGKYNDGIPDGSRLTKINEGMKEHYFSRFIGEEAEKKTSALLKKVDAIAVSLGASMAQLALAWCMYNKDVSVTMFGSTKPSQIEDNVKAIEILKKLTPEIHAQLDEILGNRPSYGTNFRTWKPIPPRLA